MKVSLSELKNFIPVMRLMVQHFQTLENGMAQPFAMLPVNKETVELDLKLAKILNQPQIDYSQITTIHIPSELVIELLIYTFENDMIGVESIERKLDEILNRLDDIQGVNKDELELVERPTSTVCSGQGKCNCQGFDIFSNCSCE